jgi:hypothetical protein
MPKEAGLLLERGLGNAIDSMHLIITFYHQWNRVSSYKASSTA